MKEKVVTGPNTFQTTIQSNLIESTPQQTQQTKKAITTHYVVVGKPTIGISNMETINSCFWCCCPIIYLQNCFILAKLGYPIKYPGKLMQVPVTTHYGVAGKTTSRTLSRETINLCSWCCCPINYFCNGIKWRKRILFPEKQEKKAKYKMKRKIRGAQA